MTGEDCGREVAAASARAGVAESDEPLARVMQGDTGDRGRGQVAISFRPRPRNPHVDRGSAPAETWGTPPQASSVTTTPPYGGRFLVDAEAAVDADAPHHARPDRPRTGGAHGRPVHPPCLDPPAGVAAALIAPAAWAGAAGASNSKGASCDGLDKNGQ